MNLVNRKDVDFTDAHLWSANAKFHTSITVSKIHELVPFLSAFNIEILSHGRDHNPDLGVQVTFTPEKFEPEVTCREIKNLFAFYAKLGGRITMEYERICVLINPNNLVIEERWSSER